MDKSTERALNWIITSSIFIIVFFAVFLFQVEQDLTHIANSLKVIEQAMEQKQQK